MYHHYFINLRTNFIWPVHLYLHVHSIGILRISDENSALRSQHMGSCNLLTETRLHLFLVQDFLTINRTCFLFVNQLRVILRLHPAFMKIPLVRRYHA